MLDRIGIGPDFEPGRLHPPLAASGDLHRSLAGQQVDYLERTMLEFKNKVRLNSPAKGTLLAAYEDDDIAAMAKYLGGF